MVNTRERDASRIVSSIARWIAGLRPAFGSKFYFEKYSVSKCIKSKLNGFKGRKFCPFCNKEFKRISSFIAHLIRVHTKDIESLVIRCNSEICKERKASTKHSISISLKSTIRKVL